MSQSGKRSAAKWQIRLMIGLTVPISIDPAFAETSVAMAGVASEEPTGSVLTQWFGPWTLLLLIPLVALKFWRNYKKTGEIPLASFLARFSNDEERISSTDAIGTLKVATASYLRSIDLSIVPLKWFFVGILAAGALWLTSSFWLPFLKN